MPQLVERAPFTVTQLNKDGDSSGLGQSAAGPAHSKERQVSKEGTSFKVKQCAFLCA